MTQRLGRHPHRATGEQHSDGTRAADRPPGVIPPEEPAVWRTLLRAQVRISRHLQTDLLAEHDLALASYDVLRHLGEAPGGRLRMNDLADRVLLSRSGLTRLVDRLHGERLVVRESCDSDARGLFAVLTTEGFERLVQATPTYQRGVRDHVLNRLDRDELHRLGSILDKLIGDPAHHSAA